MNYVYNAAVLRFMPYRGIGEFVNIGLLISFPQTDRMIFRLEHGGRRIHAFFPELDKEIWKKTLHYLKQEGQLINQIPCDDETVCFDFIAKSANEYFRRLVEPKDGLCTFGPIISGVTGDMNTIADKLFMYYVKRSSLTDFHSREKSLENRFKKTLEEFNLKKLFIEKRIGNETYNVRIPFFNEKLSIRTLDLNRDTTDIYEYGDKWIARLNRLKNIKCLKSPLLFPVIAPENRKCLDAYNDIVTSIEKVWDIQIISAVDTSKLKDCIDRLMA